MTPEEHKQLYAAAGNWCSRDGSAASGKQCGDELLFWLAKNPPVASVPVAELQALLDGPDIQGGVWNAIKALIAKHSPKPALPPNPHPQGSYLWAREESARGSVVKCESTGVKINPRPFITWDIGDFNHADFVATDWMVTK